MLIALGAGGVALNVIEIARVLGSPVVACVDETDAAERTVGPLGVPVFGSFRQAVDAVGAKQFVVAIGDNYHRERAALRISKQFPELELVSLVDPAAYVSEYAVVGCGAIIMAGSRVNANAQVGDVAYLNQNTVVAHDCSIGSAASLAPGAVLGGSVNIGDRTSIGINGSVRERTRIGSDCVVGAGAVVNRDLPGEVVVVGVPARVLRRRTPGEPYLR